MVWSAAKPGAAVKERPRFVGAASVLHEADDVGRWCLYLVSLQLGTFNPQPVLVIVICTNDKRTPARAK
jgi:hypothetical protein